MTTLLLALTIAVDAQNAPVAAVKPLPSASQLVDEALEEAKKAGVWRDWDVRIPELLLGALYDCGRAEEAKSLALECEDETDRSRYMVDYAQIVTEREGASPKFERLLLSNEVAPDTDELLGQAIAVMVRRGKVAEAEQLFDRLGRPVHWDGVVVVTNDPMEQISSANILARALIAQGNRERARKYVRVGLEAFSRRDNAFHSTEYLHDYAPLAIELGETEALKKALVAIETSATAARGYENEFCPDWFACAGRWWAALGDQEKARHDFATAEKYLIGLEERKHWDGYTELASQARLAGFTDLADEWTDRVFSRVQEEPFDDSLLLCSTIERSLIHKDRKGADIYLARITRPYGRISGRLKIAEFLIRNDDRKTAKGYLGDAMSDLESVTDGELDVWNEIDERSQLLQEIAKLHHRLNDDRAAVKFLQQAVQRTPDDDWSLWSLANTQIAIGRFQEAYATVHRIPRGKDNELQENFRLNALAELAAAYAKHEAENRRN